jgi:predicted nucleotidyltransferase
MAWEAVMIELIERHRVEVERLCRKHRVKKLEVFGSAVDGHWDAETSDVDFLVEYLPMDAPQHADAYFGLWFGLEDLLARKVDLVETPAIHNPFFLQTVNRTRQVLYAA